MYGVREFSAIINPPQSTMLAVGAGQRHPGGRRRMAASRFTTLMTVTLSCDHRVVDGALGAQLLAAFKASDRKPSITLFSSRNQNGNRDHQSRQRGNSLNRSKR